MTKGLGVLVLVAFLGGGSALPAAATERVDRGTYIARAGGCFACHTDVAGGGQPYAGGRPIKTPLGTFYSPNITPDPEFGIGGWRFADFRRALDRGVAPDGGHYFPVFPFTTYTRMTEEDAAALKVYLDSLTPVARPNRPHDVAFVLRWRRLAGVWQWLFFENARFRSDPTRDARWNRGAYLVEALTHCAECHTPRNRFGALDRDRWMAGTLEGPDGRPAPNITPHPGTGIGAWSESDLIYLMKTGLKPNFDNVQGTMAETVEHGLSHLSDKDLQAIAAYILSLPPVDNPIASP